MILVGCDIEFSTGFEIKVTKVEFGEVHAVTHRSDRREADGEIAKCASNGTAPILQADAAAGFDAADK